MSIPVITALSHIYAASDTWHVDLQKVVVMSSLAGKNQQ